MIDAFEPSHICPISLTKMLMRSFPFVPPYTGRAETRIKQGWKYGEQRNDELKTHPCLVPYEELPEEEKEYDRNTSIGTLKLIMKLGLKISQ